MKMGRPRTHDLFDEIRSFKKENISVCVCVCVCIAVSPGLAGLLEHRKSPGG